MRYSFMSFSTPKLSLSGMLSVAKKYGYDGIEPRLDAGHAHGVEVAASQKDRAAAKAQAEAAGVALACLATSLTYADPARTGEMVAQTHERIDLAGDLGVPALRVFGGVVPDGVSREEAIDVVAKSLSSVADHAAGRGVTICMETHDHWCDPAHVAAVMERVGRPSVAVNWDIMHPVRTGCATIECSFEALKPWVRHTHVHDGVGTDALKLVPIGTGDINHGAAVRLLAAAGYPGYISGEWINWEPYEVHLPRELAALKRYEQAAGG